MDEALYEICKLGEEITPKLIEIFQHKQASQQMKETIIYFWQIQIHLHKDITTESGVQWNSLFKSIVDTVLDELHGLSYQRVVK